MNEHTLKKVEALIQMCQQRDWTIGFAESCTGGLLSAYMTMVPGVSAVFMGSVVSYAGPVKEGLLGVPKSALQSYGEVSEPVARYMARGARKHLNCDWSVSITGIAGPGGGLPQKPVGTVFFAVSGPGFETAVRQQFSGPKRQDIQQQSVEFSLDLLISAMK